MECCQVCKGYNITYLECIHAICIPCFTDYAKRDFPNMKCIKCKEVISEPQKKGILGNSLYAEMESKSLNALLGNTIQCVNNECREQFVFETGNVDYNIRDEKNQKLNKVSAEHYSMHRCRCPSCKIDFCESCKVTPYHTGKTCEEHKSFSDSKKCKYDSTIIKSNNKGPADDVCNNEECVSLYKTACTKTLKCDHKCFGSKGEVTCCPCLVKDCPNYTNLYDQDEDSYCNICFSEGLGSSPVVLLSCNHFIHLKCIETRLKKKWIGPKITFNYALCSQCNKWMDCPSNPEIQAMINESKQLYDSMCKMAMERMKFENLFKDTRLTDPNSQWYKKELEFALHKISYYMCYECKKPYFAGMRECRGGPNEDNNPNREYDPKDLICGAHVSGNIPGITDCKLHGKEFIEYKCKFCCNIACWFCWGNTHFCEDCHARQCKGDYVSKYTRDKLPKCDGKCTLKVKHPDNGEEFALGCSVCRNTSDNVRNF